MKKTSWIISILLGITIVSVLFFSYPQRETNSSVETISPGETNSPEEINSSRETKDPRWSSPNGRYHVSSSGSYAVASIFDSQQNITATVIGGCMTLNPITWTADSRFLIFTTSNQYGDSESFVFDTQDWENKGSTECFHSMGPVSNRAVAVAPKTSYMLLRRAGGTLVYLPEFSEKRLDDDRYFKIREAVWSDDEEYLTFVTFDCEVFLAKGDGTQLRQIASIEDCEWELEDENISIERKWEPDTLLISAIRSGEKYKFGVPID